jgi:DNA-binding NtrC family response regulator/tetratricopeptide (TPR) repeat protein
MDPFGQVLGQCPQLTALREQARRICAQHSASGRVPPVLILGETGTGKGLLARALHQASARAEAPFVAVNCAAIPETLLEAEMFGYERGAFTDARQAKAGLFQTAHRGTIFLDEVSLLAEGLQTKLLKAIEEREVRRLGATRSEAVDLWIITAASDDLDAAYRTRQFNEALYHRLSVVTFNLPPLRERADDIALLAHHFLTQICRDYGLAQKTFTAEAEAAMRAYPWPGNVRELANAIERAVLLSDTDRLTGTNLGLGLDRPLKETRSAVTPSAPRLGDAIEALELDHIRAALTETGWNVSHAAALLGLPRNTLDYRIAKYGLRPDERQRRRRRSAPRKTVDAPARRRNAGESHMRWEPRHVGFLQVILRTGDSPPGSYATTLLTELLEKVKAFGGQVEEISPTGLLGGFGVEPSEDASARVAQAALAMRNAAERAQHSIDSPLGLSIGIHCASVMIWRIDDGGHVASEDKHAVQAVLRGLLDVADPNQIAVSPPTARLLARRFTLDAVSPADTPSTPRYRLVGLDPTGLGLGGRALSPLIGRAAELEAVKARVREVELGAGRAFGVMGEPGIGKSRLLYEIRQTATKRCLTFLEGHCAEYRRTTPYGPLLEVLRQVCGVSETDPDTVVAERVCAALRVAGLDVDSAASFLLHALGGPDGTDRLALLAPESIRRGTFDALRHLLLAQGRTQPMILAVEDLHWIDATSETFLDSLVDSIAGVPVLVLATYRPGYRPRWLDKSYGSQLTLSPLSPGDGRSIVESIVGPTGAAALTHAIVKRGDGNPFFLEELAWAVVDRHAGEHPVDAIPDTVQATLRGRLMRLPAEPRSLLQTAAVLGRTCPARLLTAIWTRTDSLSTALDELQRLEFLYERPGPEGSEYVFKHALTQEVAYASVTPEDRRALHGRVVDVIERQYPTRFSQEVHRLAHHTFRAERWEQAVSYLRLAAARAADRSAYQEAAACWEQALDALVHLPESRETLQRAVDIRLEFRRARFALGRLRDDVTAARQAEELAKKLGDGARQARACGLAANRLFWMAEYDRAVEAAERARALGAQVNDRAAWAQAYLILALTQYARGEYAIPVGALRRAIPALQAALLSVNDATLPPSVLGNHAADVRTLLNNSTWRWPSAWLSRVSSLRRHGVPTKLVISPKRGNTRPI